MIYILHIDTSAETARVAVGGDGALLAMQESHDTRNHAASINHMITEVLRVAGIGFENLDAVAVCGGPGSYTGLRIGLSTAKGLCYVLEKPLIQHSKLELLSVAEYYSHLSAYDHYVAILPARAQEYFISIHNGKFEYTLDPKHVFEPELLQILGDLHGQILTKGVLSKTIIDVIENKNVQIIENQSVDFKRWLLYAFYAYNCNSFVNLSTVEPFYLKQVYTHK